MRAQEPLNPSALANDKSNLSSAIPSIDIIQRRVVEKNSKGIVQVFASLDFSDAPEGVQMVGFSGGYSFQNNFEVSIGYFPVQFAQERSIVKMVKGLTLDNGQTANLDSPKSKGAYEVHGIWNLAYGKEAWSPESIVRSETFIKIGYRQLQFEGNLNGEKIYASFGKTFLFSPAFNFRLAAGVGTSSFYVNNEKLNSFVGLFEIGHLFYF